MSYEESKKDCLHMQIFPIDLNDMQVFLKKTNILCQKLDTKGQIILQANCQAMNSFLVLCDMFLFVCLEEIEDTKRHFEIN